MTSTEEAYVEKIEVIEATATVAADSAVTAVEDKINGLLADAQVTINSLVTEAKKEVDAYVAAAKTEI